MSTPRRAVLVLILIFGLSILIFEKGIFVKNAFAQTIQDFFNVKENPVNYDPAYSVLRGQKRPKSIDECLFKKEYFYNENHNIWVDGMERCQFNAKGVLAKTSGEQQIRDNKISTDLKDEQACQGRREREILKNGAPSEDQARQWSDHCSYLGSIGGAGPRPYPTDQSASDFGGTRYIGTPRFPGGGGAVGGGAGAGGSTPPPKPGSFEEVYRGTGVQVPSKDLVAKGISKETSLIKLIVFYTNASLPYVSVIAVFVFVAAGLYYILSFANEELNTKAKTMMTYVVIGIIIIFSAYTIVNTLLRFSEFT